MLDFADGFYHGNPFAIFAPVYNEFEFGSDQHALLNELSFCDNILMMDKSVAMTTLRVGIASYEQYKKRTLAIARGEYKRAPGEPKVWFSSIESFAKVLSEHNRELLRVIAEIKPESLNELAEATGRAKSNLSRTLKTMERYGLVRFEKGKGRKLAPRTPYTDVVLDLSLRIPHGRRTLVPA